MTLRWAGSLDTVASLKHAFPTIVSTAYSDVTVFLDYHFRGVQRVLPVFYRMACIDKAEEVLWCHVSWNA